MNYRLAIGDSPESVPGGTAVLLLHPSTAATDRIDTQFLAEDTDYFLVISTRTTAREVNQKLDYYEVDPQRASILDTLSVERGLGRRSADNIHYVKAPDDVEGIVEQTERFLREHEGKRRISFDSITELAYYADDARAEDALERIVDLIEEYDAVALFHVDKEVHDDLALSRFTELCDGVIELDESGTISTTFPDA